MAMKKKNPYSVKDLLDTFNDRDQSWDSKTWHSINYQPPLPPHPSIIPPPTNVEDDLPELVACPDCGARMYPDDMPIHEEWHATMFEAIKELVEEHLKQLETVSEAVPKLWVPGAIEKCPPGQHVYNLNNICTKCGWELG